MWPGRHTDHSPPSSDESRMNRSYNSFSPCHLHGGSRTAVLFFLMDGPAVFCVRLFKFRQFLKLTDIVPNTFLTPVHR
jgi:hypothetical protein